MSAFGKSRLTDPRPERGVSRHAASPFCWGQHKFHIPVVKQMFPDRGDFYWIS